MGLVPVGTHYKYFEPDKQNLGHQIAFINCSLQGILGTQAVVNMAAAVGRLLSFSKNAKVLASPLRLSAVAVHRYSVEVSTTGEAITHTGQVRRRSFSRAAGYFTLA